MKELNVLKEGSQFMVLDCGGGTVDITAHEVEQAEPTLCIKSIAIPSGGAWGSNYVNNNFKSFLRKLVGAAYFDSVQVSMGYEFNEVYRGFERIKVNFDPSKDPVLLSIAHVLPEGTTLGDLLEAFNAASPADEHIVGSPASLRRGCIAMTSQLMSRLFAPQLAPIVQAIEDVLTAHRGVKIIVLVGGFGASTLVHQRLWERFHDKNGVQCVDQPRPQSAIVHGAVISGIYRKVISARVSPFTYGVAYAGNIFDVVVRKGQLLPLNHQVLLTGAPASNAQRTCTWAILRSDKVHPQGQSDGEVLQRISSPCPPSRYRYDRTQSCLLKFGTEITAEVTSSDGFSEVRVIRKESESLTVGAVEELAAFLWSEKETWLPESLPEPPGGTRDLFCEDIQSCKATVAIRLDVLSTSVAYAYRRFPTIHYATPAAKDMSTKAPSTLLKMPDGSWLFGNDAETKYQQLLVDSGGCTNAQLFKGFMMVLKDKSSASFDSLSAFSTTGQWHSLLDLVSQLLRIVKEHVLGEGTMVYNEGLRVTLSDVQWVLTVPATWTEYGKAFIRRAACIAGLVDVDHSNRLMLVAEPEAAALAVQKGLAEHDFLETGSRFVIVDCGRGTVNITAHEVKRVRPKLSIQAISTPSGGPWGSESVENNFKTFLQKLLTPQHFNSMQEELALEFNDVFLDFHRIKNHSEPDIGLVINLRYILPGDRKLSELVEQYNSTAAEQEKITGQSPQLLCRGYLSINKEVMSLLMSPVIQPIVDATDAVLKENQEIKYIILVGGFSNNVALRDRIFAEFSGRNGIMCIFRESNPRPEGAILHGALWNGIYQAILPTRVSMFTFGMVLEGDHFELLLRKGQELHYGLEIQLSVIPVRVTQETFSVQILCSDKESPLKASEEKKLGSVTCPCPPTTPLKDRVMMCKVEFRWMEIRLEITDPTGNITCGFVPY